MKIFFDRWFYPTHVVRERSDRSVAREFMPALIGQCVPSSDFLIEMPTDDGTGCISDH